MGAAAYNRGTKNIARQLDELTVAAQSRTERATTSDEFTRLRRQVATLERDLKRARRCIAELRRSKEARRTEVNAERDRSDCAIRILTRIAFPGDS